MNEVRSEEVTQYDPTPESRWAKPQEVLLNSYANGEFDGLLDPSCPIQPEDLGDGLFEFLMRELSPEEGCRELYVASQRLRTIRNQVEAVLAATYRHLGEFDKEGS